LYTGGWEQDQCNNEVYPNSGLFKFPPNVALVLCLIAYFLLSIFIVMRLFIKKRSNGAICRSVFMALIMLICCVDLLWVTFDDHRTTSFIVPIANVALILLFIRAIREVWI